MVRLVALVLAIGIALSSSFGGLGERMDDDQRSELWQQVEKANKKALPKTAAELLQKIYDSAIEAQEYPEAVRALAQKYVVEGRQAQPVEPYVIRQLGGDMEKFPAEIQPIMKVILANWFFNYYQNNRWRFMQRSQTSKPPGDDFETWDLSRLLGEIDRLFSGALAASDQLKQIPIADYELLLDRGTMSDSHRPTLFDFTAFQAISFYSLDEQIIRRKGAFDVSADGPIFASRDQFLQWKINDDVSGSFLVKAVTLFQDLIEFHNNDLDKTALIDADLLRLKFGHTVAQGAEKTARYKAALQRIADKHLDHQLSATALYQLATVERGETNFAKAHEIASQGMARFPDSVGGKSCFNLVKQIEAPSLQVSTERVWGKAESTIDISYRNLDRVFFRLVKFDYLNWDWGRLRSAENFRGKPLEQLAGKQVVREWTQELPRDDEFQRQLEKCLVDFEVPSGCYVLIASGNKDFSAASNVISAKEVWGSELAVVMRNPNGIKQVSGQVFDNDSGAPIVGADVKVSTWIRDGRNSRSVDLEGGKTDERGMFAINCRERANHRIIVQHGNQVLGYVDGGYKVSSRSNYRPQENTVFFTDRAIYRPGQTVNFKGICFRSDTQKNEYETIVGRAISISIRDMNNEEVERLSFQTNDFGSFSGSFAAPRNGATGTMRIDVVEGPSGTRSFQVEEYKRPKFFVEVENPDQAFSLNDEVEIKGMAKAYTGAPIDGAKVKWRVVRNVRYPDWWLWRNWWNPIANEPQEIDSGESTTEADGSFVVPFKALPDLSVDRESEPVFTFSVYADVTDTAGETRSDQSQIRLGYASIQASLSCDKWQLTDQPVKLELATTTLDGEGVAAEGKLEIFRLQPPEKLQRAHLGSANSRGAWRPQNREPDLSRVDSWQLGERVSSFDLKAEGTGVVEQEVELQAGAYKAVFKTTDNFGRKVMAETPITVIDLPAGNFEISIPSYFQMKNHVVEVGEKFQAVWGTGYESGRAFVEILHRNKVLQSYWTDADKTQAVIEVAVTEELRGGFAVQVTYVRENRAYITSHRVQVPWSNKELQVKWERFVSKLTPGGRETWTAAIHGPNAEKTAAEMVAAMYDSSLDAFLPNRWRDTFGVFYQDYSTFQTDFQNQYGGLRNVVYNWRAPSKAVSFSYRSFLAEVAPSYLRSYNYFLESGRSGRGGGSFGGGGGGVPMLAPQGRMDRFASESTFILGEQEGSVLRTREGVVAEAALPASARDQGVSANSSVDFSKVAVRKNLNETAFFFPSLLVDEDGVVRIEFEVPEALTEWKVLGFAHDNELRTALLTDKAVTSKDLMVQPNPPRFLREGDSLEFSVKVTNQSATRQTGKVLLSFANMQDERSMDSALKNTELEKAFAIPAGQSTSLYWNLEVPDFVGVLKYKAVGGTDKLSDGEEGVLPVLSKRILVTESLPLPIRGNQTRDFDFDRLTQSDQSDTLQSQTYTVQMASNPSWYAVMSLPYLMEYPHQCSEQVFNRLYANSIGGHIVNSDPRIKQIFDQWRGTDALDSPLEKNDDLRNILIAESPWLRDAKDESQSRRDLAILFDNNRLQAESKKALNRLKQMQYSDGAWPWFPGGPANDFITLYVTTGFGRLRHLGVASDVSPALAALNRLDNWLHEKYQRIINELDPFDNHLSPMICFYLYGRSFFIQDRPIAPKYQPALKYFMSQATKYWPSLGNRQSQGHLAIGLKRFGDLETPGEIMKSLTERSQMNDELGMFWQEDRASWWWYRAPVETQALLIEAYDEVNDDAEKVEECKVWLLKQKQTQNWKTTKATADAIYALLMRGANQLASGKLVEVSLGGEVLTPTDVEVGTGFYQKKFIRDEIQPQFGQIKVTKRDDGIAWGSVHWQYLEDVGKVKPYEGTPLKLKKALFIKKNTDRGPVIEPVSGTVAVGDELVTRVELQVDRDMEYVHLKDYRGSGTEPVNVLSRYKYQDGLAYYESTKDTASHFFIDYLPRGTYVFEYSVRVQHRGKYETGIAELQCMYAPEFNSHSGSVAIEVK